MLSIVTNTEVMSVPKPNPLKFIVSSPLVLTYFLSIEFITGVC